MQIYRFTKCKLGFDIDNNICTLYFIKYGLKPKIDEISFDIYDNELNTLNTNIKQAISQKKKSNNLENINILFNDKELLITNCNNDINCLSLIIKKSKITLSVDIVPKDLKKFVSVLNSEIDKIKSNS